MTKRDRVIDLIQNLVHQRLRFRFYGRSPDYGMDCIGLVIWIGQQIGSIAHDAEFPCYSFPPTTENFNHLDEYLDRTDDILPGSILVFTTGNQIPGHVAIATYQQDKIWMMFGSIPGGFEFGYFPLIPTISENVWKIFDYKNVA